MDVSVSLMRSGATSELRLALVRKTARRLARQRGPGVTRVMGRFRTALATISVGAMLATGHAAQRRRRRRRSPTSPPTSPQPGTGGVPTGPDEPVTPVPGSPASRPRSPTPDNNGSDRRNRSSRQGQAGGNDGGQQKLRRRPTPAARDRSRRSSRPLPRSSITVDPNLGLSVQLDPGSGLRRQRRTAAQPDPDLHRGRAQVRPRRARTTDPRRDQQDRDRLRPTQRRDLLPPARSAGCSSCRRPGTRTAIDGDGDGKADPYNPADAIHAAARYLQRGRGARPTGTTRSGPTTTPTGTSRTCSTRPPVTAALQDTTEVDEDLKVFVCKPAERRILEIPNYYMRAFESAASRYELGQQRRLDAGRGRPARVRLRPRHDREAAEGHRPDGPRPATSGSSTGSTATTTATSHRDEPWDGIATFARMLWSHGRPRGRTLRAQPRRLVRRGRDRRRRHRSPASCDTVKTTWDIAYPAADHERDRDQLGQPADPQPGRARTTSSPA